MCAFVGWNCKDKTCRSSFDPVCGVKSHAEMLITSYRCIPVTIYWVEAGLCLVCGSWYCFILCSVSSELCRNLISRLFWNVHQRAVIHTGVQTCVLEQIWCPVRKLSPDVSDLTQAATVRAGVSSQGQVHIKVGEARQTPDMITMQLGLFQHYKLCREILFLRQHVKVPVTEMQMNCEAEELSQATQLPPTASCLKSLSPAVSCIQSPRLRNSTCPAHRNLLHFNSVTSVCLILLRNIHPSYIPSPP